MSRTIKRNSFTISVKPVNKKEFNVEVGPLDTVGALKQRIFEREGTPVARQRLLILGQLMQPDTRSLKDYNLKAGDIVYVVEGYRGPGTDVTRSIDPPVTAVTTQAKVTAAPVAAATAVVAPASGTTQFSTCDLAIEKPFAADGPKWKTVFPGLSFWARCPDAGCPANGGWVIVSHGVRNLRVSNGVFETYLCPACAINPKCPTRSAVHIDTSEPLVWACRYRGVHGIKADGTTVVAGDWLTCPRENRFRTLHSAAKDPEGNPTGQITPASKQESWRELLLEVKELEGLGAEKKAAVKQDVKAPAASSASSSSVPAAATPPKEKEKEPAVVVNVSLITEVKSSSTPPVDDKQQQKQQTAPTPSPQQQAKDEKEMASMASSLLEWAIKQLGLSEPATLPATFLTAPKTPAAAGAPNKHKRKRVGHRRLGGDKRPCVF
jgi:hypothetical protein